jgi:ketosteroid isomerase-like protein
MKKLMFTFLSLFIFSCIYSQNQKVEKEIRQIEEKRIAAYMAKDTATILKIYAPGYFVNSPSNRVIALDEFIKRLMSGVISTTDYVNTIEKISIHGNVVISMGHESYKGAEKNPEAGQTITMRYTNFWIKEKDGWKLFARHANIVCKQ